MTTPRLAIAPSCPPIGLRRDQAAIHVGISPSHFDDLVKAGDMPQPRLLDGAVVWDREELEAAFRSRPRRGAVNPLDDHAHAA